MVPNSVNDEYFTKISKGFKHGRFPVITWKSEVGALLIRGAGLTSQTMVSRFKKQANLRNTMDSHILPSAADVFDPLTSHDFSSPSNIDLQVFYRLNISTKDFAFCIP